MEVFVFVCLVIICLSFLHACWEQWGVPKVLERRESESLQEFIQPHLKALILHYERGHRIDEYGAIIDCGWGRELTRYYSSQVLPRFPHVPFNLAARTIIKEMNSIPLSIREGWELDPSRYNSASPAEAGALFELDVQREMRANGWDVRRVGGPGDAGADLVGERNGERVVVQCKYISQGKCDNGAVQEAFAAQRHHLARRAVVISNVAFTNQAKKQAHSLGVELCDYSQIEDL